jgi:outer membrane biosynthesis protein TonB
VCGAHVEQARGERCPSCASAMGAAVSVGLRVSKSAALAGMLGVSLTLGACDRGATVEPVTPVYGAPAIMEDMGATEQDAGAPPSDEPIAPPSERPENISGSIYGGPPVDDPVPKPKTPPPPVKEEPAPKTKTKRPTKKAEESVPAPAYGLPPAPAF